MPESARQCMDVHHLFDDDKSPSKIALAVQKFCYQIIWRGLVRNRFAAAFAYMNDQPTFLAVVVDMVWTHQCQAGRSPIAGSCAVHVLRIQAKRAMVAIAAVGKGVNFRGTMAANEGFLSCYKCCHTKDFEEIDDIKDYLKPERNLVKR